MRRELLLLSEMRDSAATIRDLVGDRSAEQVEADALSLDPWSDRESTVVLRRG
ncbi:MAG: hypothetical protein WCG47_23720 [Dermatophilaceae bacterium]